MSLGLAIPLLNESALVETVARETLSILKAAQIPVTLALVNNGSSDDTGTIVDALSENSSVLPIHLTENAGYGGGILAGIQALLALPTPPRIIGWGWGDHQIDPAILPSLYRACEAGAPMAKTVRTAREDGWQRQFITLGYAVIMRRLMGVHTADVNGCPKLFRREALADLSLQSTDWFLDAEAIFKAEERKWEIASREVTMRPRTAGISNVRMSTIAEFVRNLMQHTR